MAILPPPRLHIDRVVADRQALLRLRGELDFETVPQLRGCLTQLDAPGRAIVLDLSDLVFIDSSGLAALLEARARAAANDAPLRLQGVSQQVRELLERTGLQHVLSA
jgi:anti-sigma B factor antagonist